MTAYMVFCTTHSLDDPGVAMRGLLAFLQPARVLGAWGGRQMVIPPAVEGAEPASTTQRVLHPATMSRMVEEKLADAALSNGCVSATLVTPLGRQLASDTFAWSAKSELGRFDISGLFLFLGETRINVVEPGNSRAPVHATAAVAAWGMGSTPEPAAARASILRLPIVREIADGLAPILGMPETLVWWSVPHT